MTPRARRALFTVVLFFAVCAVVGSVLQRKVGAESSADESQLRDSLKSFTNVYALVEENYAEPISGDKADTAIYDGAIPGMLRVLDPHSNFYDPKAYARMREEQRGHYYGVGMTIVPENGKVYVVYPAEGAPAFRAGIHPGDVIYAVDSKLVSVDGKNPDGLTTSDQVAKALKGPKGTHVQATMLREGQPKPLVFDLVRDEIPHPSVDLAYQIRPGVGYIHLSQFQETTAEEVDNDIDGFGIVRDRTTTATAGITQNLDTGTAVTIQSGSSRADTTSAGAIYDTFYTSSVQLMVTQSLLQGNSREANLADLYTARDQLAGNREVTLQNIESQLEGLGEDWLNYAQRESEVKLRKSRQASS